MTAGSAAPELPSAPGSTLVTVSGAVARPGVYEIEMGTPIGQVVMLAGGPAEPLQALLVGGYFGAWLPVAGRLAGTDDPRRALQAAGGALGAGIVIALPASACPLAETARVVRYLAEENAGQCGPCMFGLPALADALGSLAYGGGRDGGPREVAVLLPLIERRGACRHPDGVTQLVRSAAAGVPGRRALARAHRIVPGVGRPPLLPVPRDEDREWDCR